MFAGHIGGRADMSWIRALALESGSTARRSSSSLDG
jgi:hypothetical protein